MRWTLAVASIGIALLASACAGADDASTLTTAQSTEAPTTTVATTVAPVAAPTTTTTTTGPATTTPTSQPPNPIVPDQLADLDLAVIVIDGEPLLVAVADTAATRNQGLMAVTDLGDLDGMLFVWDTATSGGFWMRNTVIPLDIAFFTDTGTLVSVLQMAPCADDEDCPVYRAAGEYRYALETPLGALIDLPAEARLEVPTS